MFSATAFNLEQSHACMPTVRAAHRLFWQRLHRNFMLN
jgi:hypothetical protein